MKEQKQINSRVRPDRVQVKLSSQGTHNQPIFLIYCYQTGSEECLEVTVRKFEQVQRLSKIITDEYGGLVIPELEFNIFNQRRDPQTIIVAIGEYLRDLLENPHCQNDSILLDFLMLQETTIPPMERYEKVLSDAATLSRRYLNSFFTKKESSLNRPHSLRVQNARNAVIDLKKKLESVRDLANKWQQQHELMQEVASIFYEQGGELGMAVRPLTLYSGKTKKQVEQLWRLLTQGEQAVVRWQVLQQSVRELQCNVEKGMHEDEKYLKEQEMKLGRWTKTIPLELQQLVKEGQRVLSGLGKHLYEQKKEQVSSSIPSFKQQQ